MKLTVVSFRCPEGGGGSFAVPPDADGLAAAVALCEGMSEERRRVMEWRVWPETLPRASAVSAWVTGRDADAARERPRGDDGGVRGVPVGEPAARPAARGAGVGR